MNSIKNPAVLLTVLVIVCLCASACAAAWYVKTPNGKTVNIRDEKTNEVIGYIPYGTRVTTNENKDAQTAAYVTYNGVSGYVSYRYLVREKPEPYQRRESPSAEPTAEPEAFGEGQYSVSVTGGVLQFQNKKGKAEGNRYSEIRFDEPVSVTATATIPKGKKIDYWMVNGVKLKLSAKTLKIICEQQDVSVVIVFK